MGREKDEYFHIILQDMKKMCVCVRAWMCVRMYSLFEVVWHSTCLWILRGNQRLMGARLCLLTAYPAISVRVKGGVGAK